VGFQPGNVNNSWEAGNNDTISEGGTAAEVATEKPLDDQGLDADRPTEEEKHTLRRVAGNIPKIAYLICAVEFAERASYYGVQPLFNNFVKQPLPKGGNGQGAPPPKSENTAGALDLKGPAANATSQSFSMLVYALPVLWGWLADTKTGRWKLIVWGVLICGVAHVLMVGAAAPALLQAHKAVAPFMISVYVLALGAGRFFPCSISKSSLTYSSHV
jgi:dipeptide/tripeptide permease